ncbi:ParA family protein [Pontibacter akesuensis]|uniref:Chromosome partitioning protein n=1 Tax=Pontibacter akesuensis TaxID=388950 RepID=A0A1I7KRF4_9BACT|nr:ParA family protein [Pontibacter akesuensis]GHA81160.1 sporulation initiation inhibitor Soj [Pontibacter akesuensis]SFU99954.1 chromosome partitioning protein [Pontibacter akesuensis]
MTKVLSIVNAKGGVAKTTSTLGIGYALKEMGMKVLLVDLDAQANLTTSVGISPREELNISDALLDNCKITEVIREANGVDIAYSGHSLISRENAVAHSVTGAAKLRSILKKVKDRYDYVIIDCPPSLGIYTVNALIASDKVYIPMVAEPFAWNGLDKMLETVDIIVEEELNPKLKLGGLFFTNHSKNAQTILGKTIVKEAQDQLGDRVLKTAIRTNVALNECLVMNQDVFSYAPDSNGAKDYRALTKEIVNS